MESVRDSTDVMLNSFTLRTNSKLSTCHTRPIVVFGAGFAIALQEETKTFAG
jgi:hypothetical protein